MAAPAPATATSDRILTVPNVVTAVRIGLLGVFLWLLLVEDQRLAAAAVLAVVGCTDWVDGYLARHLGQVSELGKVLDPIADRLVLIFGVGGIIVVGAAPLWFSVAVVVRELLVAGAVLLATAFGMERFDVSWWGKAGTFDLYISFPLFLIASAGDAPLERLAMVAAWGFGIPGLVLAWVAAIGYVPRIRAGLRAGRQARSAS